MEYLYSINDIVIEYGQVVGGVVIAHCAYCGESLHVRREVLLDEYNNYYCNEGCLYEHELEQGWTHEEDMVLEKVVLCL